MRVPVNACEDILCALLSSSSQESQCYFLLSASPSTPIIYSVDRVRDGKSYVTRAVKALQDGRVIFIMLCSFQLPESWQPQHQWPIPKVPSPEECDLQEVRYAKMLERPDLNPKVRDFFEAVIAVSLFERCRRLGVLIESACVRNEPRVPLRSRLQWTVNSLQRAWNAICTG